MDADELAAELIVRSDRDQAARADAIALASDAQAWERVQAVDAEDTAWLREVLDHDGWPRRSVVGGRAAADAWLLAQHADADREFQRRCLVLLRAAVDEGEADAASWAYLCDRVRRADGQPQLYGTQFWYGPEGNATLAPQPIEDPDRLDERRQAVGLTPFAEYERLMREREPPS